MNNKLVSIDIPAAERALNVVLLELDAPWPSEAPIAAALAALESLGLGLARTSVDLEETWTPYSRADAAAAVWRGTRHGTAVTLGSADGRLRAAVARYDRTPRSGPPSHRNTVSFTLPADDVRSRGLQAVEAGLATVLAALPSFTLATASACRPVRFPGLMDCLQPPPPMEQSAWLHVVGERAWPRLGVTPRLPGAPLRSELRADGAVWIWSYPDPLRYDSADAIDGMRAFCDQMRAPA